MPCMFQHAGALVRRFPQAMFSHVVIPVLRAVLQDHDVVYAPLIAGYGSCTGAWLSVDACLSARGH